MPFNIENFANDYYIDVDSPEYEAILEARKASLFDQNLLLVVETMRAMITTLDSEVKARMFRQVIYRMLAAIPDSPQSYTDRSAAAVGNISINIDAITEPCGFTFSSEITGSGDAPFVDSIYFDFGDLDAVETVDQLVTALNLQITSIGAAAWVVAFRTIDSRVGFRLTPAGGSCPGYIQSDHARL